MKKIKIEMWIMPSGEEKIKAITIDNQRPLDAFMPSMQYAISKEEKEKLDELMLSRVNCPCELYKQGILEISGVLKSYNKDTLVFDIE